MAAAKGNYPEWEGSEAQSWLKKDMKAGKHDTLQPMELWETRDAYQLFPLEVFRDHIYQEIRTGKFLNQLKNKPDTGYKWKEFRNKPENN